MRPAFSFYQLVLSTHGYVLCPSLDIYPEMSVLHTYRGVTPARSTGE